MDLIRHIVSESIRVKQELLQDEEIIRQIRAVADRMISTFRADGKVLFCGNGGSAADALHLATELAGRFYLERKPLYAEALNVNTPNMTAISNDYSYEVLFARMVEAKGRKGDVLVAISTSGKSPNVLHALKQAKIQGMVTIGFCGARKGEMDDLCDQCIHIPSEITPRIQESHILIGHIICEIVEKELFT